MKEQCAVLNTRTFLCCIKQCATNDGVILDKLHVYGLLIANVPGVVEWICTGEYNKDGIYHVHAMVKTLSRTDAYRRAVNTTWKSLGEKQHWDEIDIPILPDYTMDVLKCQKCHKPESMLAYLMKSPLCVMSNTTRLLDLALSLQQHGCSQRFIQTENEIPNTMHVMTTEITQVIIKHQCKTFEECLRHAPDTLAQYLHRPGINTIVENCIKFVLATAHQWTLQTYAKQKPNPERIHQILLHQGVNIDEWDLQFKAWITKTSDKKNTLVLFGPSNTGKSKFIQNLKECVPWGEIVNSNTFAFEALQNTYLGIWEEPLVSPELAEKAKQIFEGMSCSIPIKYKKPYVLPRTPILMTTNHVPWRFCTKEEDMFKNRMYIYKFPYVLSPRDECNFRGCSGSCRCCYCTACRGGEAPASGGSSSIPDLHPECLPRHSREWSISSSDGSESEVSTRSMPTLTKWDDSPRPASPKRSRKNKRAQSPGSSQRSGSSVSNRVRSSGSDRSSHSHVRIHRPEQRSGITMVTYLCNGYKIHAPFSNVPFSVRESGEYTVCDPRQCRECQEVGQLGKEAASLSTEIPTRESELGEQVDALDLTLAVPTKKDWEQYFAYLTTL